MTTSETSSPLKRRLCHLLITLAAFALTVAIFYGEEDFRGWRAMEKCKRQLEAHGVSLNWRSYIPAPVPEDENVFGVPEMQEGFVGRGQKNLTKNWPNPGWDSKARLLIAHITNGQLGSSAPAGYTVLQLGDNKAATEYSRLIRDALGPVALDPSGHFYTKQSPEDIHPVQIFLECPKEPSENDMQSFISATVFSSWNQSEKMQVERAGDGSWNVTMQKPTTAVEFLKGNAQLEPTFAMIRTALQRPYARMNGDYSNPSEIPIPAFVTLRTVAQRLAAMAQCHFLLNQPEEALQNLTLTHDLCRRVLEDNQIMTLISAMINVAIRGLDAGVIDDGLEMHAWREPQLVALEEQLKQINILGPVKQSFEKERAGIAFHLTQESPAMLAKYFLSSDIVTSGNSKHHPYSIWSYLEKSMENSIHKGAWQSIPRGWSYQNAVVGESLFSNVIAFIDSSNELVYPAQAEIASKRISATFKHWSPYTFLVAIMIPNFSRACHTTAENQTKINQALIACALERYRLAHGQYPESLDELIPQFIDAIPHDVIGGKPPHYRRNADGTFLLYSIGWDEQDHGGLSNVDLVWPEKEK